MFHNSNRTLNAPIQLRVIERAHVSNVNDSKSRGKINNRRIKAIETYFILKFIVDCRRKMCDLPKEVIAAGQSKDFEKLEEIVFKADVREVSPLIMKRAEHQLTFDRIPVDQGCPQ